MAEKKLSAIEQLAENAADAVCEKYGVERNEGESSVAALAWALGDETTYEQGLVELVEAAVALKRDQIADVLRNHMALLNEFGADGEPGNKEYHRGQVELIFSVFGGEDDADHLDDEEA